MSGTSYISGIVSGLQTDEILSQLESLARAPVVRLESKKSALSAKLSAWQQVNTTLLALKSAAADLASFTAFSDKSAASSNESLVSVTANSSAIAGDYTFTVESLATRHSIVSQGFDDPTASVGTGTVTISTGGTDPTVIDVNDLSLEGLRDAINIADAGVRAYIVNDGSDTTPYKLVLASESSGSDGEISVNTNLSGGTAPAFSDLQAASDAVISMGTGLTITRSSNVISDLIPGVTLNLHGASPGSPVTVTVSADSEAIKEKVQEFVGKYNEVVSLIEKQWAYDQDTEKSGTLFGEYTLHQMQSSMVSRLSNPIAGLPSSMSLLSQIGISLGDDGRLELDAAELDAALAENMDGVMKLFARYGESTDSRIAFVSATDITQPSGEIGYAVNITQVATHARVTSGVAQSAVLAADEVLTINGINIELTAGMTQLQVLEAINDSNAGVTASATGIDGTGVGQYLTLESNGYGAGAEVTVISSLSNAAGDTSGVGNVLVTESDAAGESGTGTGAAGTDVAGTINGAAAEGAGQILKGTEGDTEGLSLLINSTTTGDLGSVTFTRGAGAHLDDLLRFLTESETGTVQVSMDTLEEQIENIEEDITAREEAIARQQDRLYQQFSAMEGALAKLQSQGSYLSGQLAQIQSNWKGA